MVTQRVFPEDFTAVNKFDFKAQRPEEHYKEELSRLEALQKHQVGLDRKNPKNKVIMTPMYRNSDNASALTFGQAANAINI